MAEKKNPLTDGAANGNTERLNQEDYTMNEPCGEEVLKEWAPEDERTGYRAEWVPEAEESRLDIILRRVVLILAGALVFMIGTIFGMILISRAGAEGSDGWIICQPGDYINARSGASRKSGVLGRLDCGDVVHLAGGSKNGFLKVERLSMEESEGWVYSGYVIYEAPRNYGGKVCTVAADGRVACRKYIEGPRRCWIHAGDTVKVYSAGGGWAVTNKGFIRTEYLTGI